MINIQNKYGHDYSRWLNILSKYRGSKLRPTREIDDVWHLHLASPTYASDCKKYLGYVPKHIRNEGGEAYTPSFTLFKKIWKQLYGESIKGMPAICDFPPRPH